MREQTKQQLQQAYALLKQGNKREAKAIVLNILRQDRENVYALWLLAHTLEDKNHITRALEHVLALKPDHKGAQKMLADLHPDSDYADPLANPMGKPKQKSDAFTLQRQSSSIIPLVVVMISLFFVGLVIFAGDQMLEVVDPIDYDAIEGYPAEWVLAWQLHEAFNGDMEASLGYTCPHLHGRVRDGIEQFRRDTAILGDTYIDTSQLRTEIVSEDRRNVVVRIYGYLTFYVYGEKVSFDIDELLALVGYSENNNRVVIRLHDNRWKVCS